MNAYGQKWNLSDQKTDLLKDLLKEADIEFSGLSEEVESAYLRDDQEYIKAGEARLEDLQVSIAEYQAELKKRGEGGEIE